MHGGSRKRERQTEGRKLFDSSAQALRSQRVVKGDFSEQRRQRKSGRMNRNAAHLCIEQPGQRSGHPQERKRKNHVRVSS